MSGNKNPFGDLAEEQENPFGDLASRESTPPTAASSAAPKQKPGALTSLYSGYEASKMAGIKALVEAARALMGKGKAPSLDSVTGDYKAMKGGLEQVVPQEVERLKTTIPNKAASALAGYTANGATYPTALFGNAPTFSENLDDSRAYFKQAIAQEPESNFVGSLASPVNKLGGLSASKIANPLLKAGTGVLANGAVAAGQSAASDYALEGSVNGKRAALSGGASSLMSLLPAIASPVAKYFQKTNADEILAKAANQADDKISSNMGKFDETLQNRFYKPAEKTLENPDPSIPLELLQQADDVTRTKLTHGTEEFARNMDDFGGKLPARPVAPREQMIANEAAAIREGGKLGPKFKKSAQSYVESQGVIPEVMRFLRDYAGDPASRETMSRVAGKGSDFLAKAVPGVVNATREAGSRRLSPDELEQLLAEYNAKKGTQVP